LVFAGHQATLGYILGDRQITEDEIVVYGEPFAAITELARQERLVDQMRGNAFLGPLLNLREYRPPATNWKQQTHLLLTSLGCQKRCGYCTYGVIYSRLYGANRLWRSRPAHDLHQELTEIVDRGITRIWLAAHQLVSKNGEDNDALLHLTHHWENEQSQRPELCFDLSPTEVLSNKQLLEFMSCSFDIFPRLSVDSFDDDTLDLLDLTHNAAAAMEAVEFLSHLKVSFRINYILIRPGMNLGALRRELRYLREVDTLTSYMTPQHKLLMANDFLWNHLRLHPCMPVVRKLGKNKTYEKDIPARCLRVISRMRELLETKINDFTHQSGKSPLLSVVEAGMNESLFLS
jgi:hypothetical protein